MKLRKLVTMREALASDGYFGRLLAGDSWAAWRALLIAIVGEELTEDERGVFEGLTGREREPLEPVEEFWAVIGRRGGKTRSMAVLAAYIAGCVDHRDTLAPGERGALPILAASTAQASQAFNFVSGIFATAPNLKDLLENETADTISLASGVDITIRPASFRTIRGITAVAAIARRDRLLAQRRQRKSRYRDPAGVAAGAGDDRRLACGASPRLTPSAANSTARSSGIMGRLAIRQFSSPRRRAGR